MEERLQRVRCLATAEEKPKVRTDCSIYTTQSDEAWGGSVGSDGSEEERNKKKDPDKPPELKAQKGEEPQEPALKVQDPQRKDGTEEPKQELHPNPEQH